MSRLAGFRQRLLGLLLLGLCWGCSIEPEQAEAAERVAKRTLDKAEQGIDKGAYRARRQWEKAKRDYGPAARRDWEKLKDAASKAWQQAEHEAKVEHAQAPPLPEQWWTKAAESVDCPSEDSCRVEAWYVAACQRQPLRVRDGLRLTPVYDPAQPDKGNTGVEVRSIAPGSVLDQLGFEDGDELRSINGLNVADPMAQIGLYGQLRDQRRFEVVLARGGQHLRKTIEVVDEL